MKHPYWFVRWRTPPDAEGRRVRKSLKLGYCPTTTDLTKRHQRAEITKSEAERMAADLMEAINAPSESRVTLGEFVAEHWRPRHLVNVGVATIRKYESHLRNHVIRAFGSLTLAEVTTLRIQDLVNSLKADGKSWHLRNNVLGVLSSIFTKAQVWGFYPNDQRNPCRGVDLGRKTEVREKLVLTPEQLDRVVEGLSPRVAILARLLDETGCRISEALGLQEKHIDLAQGRALIAQSWSRGNLAEPKTETSRRFVMLGSVAHELPSIMTGDPAKFLFDRGDGEPWDDRELLRHELRPALVRRGLWVEGLGWHSLRRKAISEWQAAGASSIEVGKMAGHSRPITTFEYTQLSPGRLDEIARKRREVQSRGSEGGAVSSSCV